MHATELREAASLLRARAQEATGASWTLEAVRDGNAVIHFGAKRGAPYVVCHGDSREENVANAELITTMQPGLALALADWLDHESDTFDFIGDVFESPAGQVAATVLGRRRIEEPRSLGAVVMSCERTLYLRGTDGWIRADGEITRSWSELGAIEVLSAGVASDRAVSGRDRGTT